MVDVVVQTRDGLAYSVMACNLPMYVCTNYFKSLRGTVSHVLRTFTSLNLNALGWARQKENSGADQPLSYSLNGARKLAARSQFASENPRRQGKSAGRQLFFT